MKKLLAAFVLFATFLFFACEDSNEEIFEFENELNQKSQTDDPDEETSQTIDPDEESD